MLAALLGAANVALAQGAGGQPIVAQIRIEGNLRVDSNAILLHVDQKAGQPLNPDTVSNDEKSIYEMGFFSDVGSKLVTVNGQTVLVYVVKERPQVNDVKFVGMKAFRPTDDKIVTAVKVHVGEVVDPVRIQETITELTKLYQDKSYLDVKITDRSIAEPDNSEVVVFDIDEGPLVRINQIKFVGNKAFTDDELRGVMETATYNRFFSWLTGSGALDKAKLTEDVDHLSGFYYDEGYLSVHVSQPEIKRTGNSITLTFHIDEGPPYKVGRIAIAGNLKYPRRQLLKLLTIKRGENFQGSVLQHDVLSLSDFYLNRGYAYANVDPRTEVRPAQKLVNVLFYITPGQEVLVNRINITGNTKTADKVIRRELLFQEQEPYSAEAIRESKTRLDRLGFFTETRITTEPAGSPDKINIDVNVSEANTAQLQVAGGFDSYQSLFGNFTLGNTNLFGGGEAVILSAQIGFLFQNFSISYTEPWFLDIPLSVTTRLFDNKSYLPSFNESSAGGAVQSSYPLTELGFRTLGPFSLKNVTAGLGYQFESVGVTGLPPLTTFQIARYRGYSQTSEILPSIRRLTVDNPIDPRSGTNFTLDGQIAGLGGSNYFLKVVMHARYFYTFLKSPTWGSWVVSQGVTYGIGTDLQSGSGGDLPLFERFFPGGTSSNADVRGYQQFSLGPLVTLFNQAGTPISVQHIGGSKELLLSNEITFPILSSLGLRGVIFSDAGQSFLLHQSLDPSDLQASYGVGVRWRSPFGPFAVDIARPINPRPEDQHTVFELATGAQL